MTTEIFIQTTPVQITGGLGRHLAVWVVVDGVTTVIDAKASGSLGADIDSLMLLGEVVLEKSIVESAPSQSEIEEFNLTQLTFGSQQEAETAATQFFAYYDDMGTTFAHEGREFIRTGLDYGLLGPNSNSVGNSLLSAIGVNYRSLSLHEDGNSSLTQYTPSNHVGHLAIVDSGGNETYTAFAYNNKQYTFFDGDGTDSITVEVGASIKILDTGANGANALILKGFDPEDIYLVQDGDQLKIFHNIAGDPVLVAEIENHFDPLQLVQTTLLQFVDAEGDPIPDTDIDLSDLEPLGLLYQTVPDSILFEGNPVGAASNVWDPLIIDLDGDGVAADTGGFGRYFDLDSDDFAEVVPWIGLNDGFLVRDLNDNGRIDNGSEMFGDNTTNGFTALAALDSNTDDAITSADTAWGDLLVWIDGNTDAQTQPGELHTLASLGITSINLGSVTEVNITDPDVGLITHAGTVTTTTGTTEIVSMNFTTEPSGSRYVGDYDLDPLAAVLPDLIGRGYVADLHIAMSLDNDTEDPDSLLSIMQDIASYSAFDLLAEYDEVKDKATDLLFRWAGVDENNPAGRGTFLSDGRVLDFMEKYMGTSFIDPQTGTGIPQVLQAQAIEDYWLEVRGNLLTKIMLQLGVDEFLSGFSFNFYGDEVQGYPITLDQDFIDEMEAYATSLADTEERLDFWLNVADFIRDIEWSIQNTFASYTEFSALSSASETALNTAVSNSDADLVWKIEDHTYGGNPVSVEYRHFNPVGDIIEGDNNVNDYTVNSVFGGTTGNDTIKGYGGNDNLQGGDGDDVLYGGDDNDTLSGGNGQDALYGEDGNDTLMAGNGTQGLFDFLYAGAGNDTLFTYTNSGIGSVFADGGAGDDLYHVRYNGWLADSAGDDTAYIFDTGIDAVDLSFERLADNTLYVSSTAGFGVNFYIQNHFNNPNFTIETIQFASGDDDLDLTALSVDVVTQGNNLDETIYGIATGGGVNDEIYGDNGIDTIYGGSGNDEIYGESDGDFLYGEAGNDTIFGGTGDDLIDGGEGDDFLQGDGGVDTFVASSGNDTFQVQTGDVIDFGSLTEQDVTVERLLASGHGRITHAGGQITVNLLFNGGGFLDINLKFASGTIPINAATIVTNGTSGNDTISGIANGGTGLDDIIYGYDGNDSLTGGKGFDILIGGLGNDTLNGGDAIDTASYLPSLTGVTVSLTTNTATGEGTDTLTSIEDIIGSNYNDTLTGNGGSGQLFGEGGNDSIFGLAGNDFLYGGDDDDLIDGGSGDDLIDGGNGTDTATYATSTSPVNADLNSNSATGYGTDTLLSIENVIGSGLADSITGNASANSLEGGDGNDLIEGRGGDDDINGGGGIDTVTYENAAAGVYVDMLISGLTTNDGDGGVDALANIENVIGSGYADTIYGNDGANTLYGGAGNDWMSGTDGDDILYGDGGNDTLHSGQGTDTIYGGDGNDTLYGRFGTNTLYGEAGNDKFSVPGGADTIDGGSGTDEVQYNGASAAVTVDLSAGTVDEGQNSSIDDTLVSIEDVLGSSHADTLIGDSGANKLNGGNGNDLIYGGGGVDNLIGSVGNDILYGEDGNDFVYGNADNDTLYGGAGNDTMMGGPGADIFVFESGTTSGYSDTINDFDTTEGDAIDISDLLSGYDPMTHAITDFVQFTDNGTHSYLAVDADGGADNFVQIAQLLTVTGLTDEEALETSGNLIAA